MRLHPPRPGELLSRRAALYMKPQVAQPAGQFLPVTPPDNIAWLSVYVFLLIAIPSKLVVGPLGGSGTPAQIVGLFAALSWCRNRMRASGTIKRPGVSRFAWRCGGFVLSVLLSFVAAMTRPIEPEELNTAMLGVVGVISWLGILLIANDGIPSVDRLKVIVRRIAAMGGALATLGIVQFFTHQPWTNSTPIWPDSQSATRQRVRLGWVFQASRNRF